MSRWDGIESEAKGVRLAVVNLKYDKGRIASYVYDRACSYVGIDHEGVTVRLFAEALDAMAGRPDTQGAE